MKKLVYSLAVVASGLLLNSCNEDFTKTQFHQSELAAPLTSVEQLQSFVNGTYAKMRASNYLGSAYRGIGEVHTDEMYCTLRTGRNQAFATYQMLASTAQASDIYYAIYQVIGNANLVINASNNLTWGESIDATTVANKINHLKGQAYAARALATFDLLRLFGQEYAGGTLGVILPNVYNPNALQARATVEETRAQIEADFTQALSLMSAYETANSNQLKVINKLNSNSVKALMSRYYLYKGDNTNAAKYAQEVIDSGNYSVVSSGNFLSSFSTAGGTNSIFELTVGTNGSLGTNSYDNLVHSTGYRNLAVLPAVIRSYDTADVRAGAFSGRFLNNKFSVPSGTSNIKLVRYEEILLNAAEAYVTTNNAKALEYYNLIRQNRGLAAATSVTLADIKNERKLELLGEGFRYWDLLRWNETIPFYRSNGTANTTQDKVIGNYQLAFPIPESETDVPGSPVVQNTGY